MHPGTHTHTLTKITYIAAVGGISWMQYISICSGFISYRLLCVCVAFNFAYLSVCYCLHCIVVAVLFMLFFLMITAFVQLNGRKLWMAAVTAFELILCFVHLLCSSGNVIYFNAYVYINLTIPLGYLVGFEEQTFWERKSTINEMCWHVAFGHLLFLALFTLQS